MENLVTFSSSFWRNRRVLVTGHTGFKGSWLLLWLHKLGAKIWGFSLEPNTNPNLFSQIASDMPPGESWYHEIGDIRDKLSLDELIQSIQPEVVFHMAAQPLVRRSYENPIETWSTNVIGSLNVLESLKLVKNKCSVVMVTTDKVYENKEWIYSYRETDPLGGNDPYSASKAATEIAISSWRKSFCGREKHQTSNLKIATARAGNVIGGGDWSVDRIVPDAMRSQL